MIWLACCVWRVTPKYAPPPHRFWFEGVSSLNRSQFAPVAPVFLTQLARALLLSTFTASFFIQPPDPAVQAQSGQPRIIINNWMLVDEDCASPDGIIDPGEKATISVALQNTGTANTSQQLTATLQATGGVTAPGPMQDYGRLNAGGPPTSRNFTFTAASQQLGSTITATFQIQDGGVNRGSLSVTITLGLLTLETEPGLCAANFRVNSPTNCPLTHCVSTRRPPFPIGDYTVICDTAASRFTFLLTVVDREAPQITRPADVSVTAFGSAPAVVNYSTPAATDNCQGVNVVCTPPSGSSFPIGSTTVNCNATDAAGNTASCSFKVTVNQQSELPLTPSVASSDQKPGSLLVYPLFTSSPTSQQAQNTRLSITNIEPVRQAYLHLFFIDGSTCNVSDAFVCLTPWQTMTFLASDLDPGVTGYVIAVAVDGATGCPINFNYLIGDEYVKLASGHQANLGAESFAAIAAAPANCSPTATSAELRLDGQSYGQAARVLAIDNIASRADGNDELLIINRLGGDLRTSAATLGQIFSLVFDDLENSGSGTLSGGCQLATRINFSPGGMRFDSFVPAGRTGWMKFYGQSEIAICGAYLNFNPNAKASPGAFNHGRNLHHLSLTNAGSLTIPVAPPRC